MAGVNKVILVGHLGKTPESMQFDGGTTKTSFTLATSEVYKDKNTGERKTKTEWHSIVMFGKVAEIAAKYLEKGSHIYLEGKLTHRSYDDKEGNKKYITEVVARELTMLGSNTKQSIDSTASANTEQVNTDDLPF